MKQNLIKEGGIKMEGVNIVSFLLHIYCADHMSVGFENTVSFSNQSYIYNIYIIYIYNICNIFYIYIYTYNVYIYIYICVYMYMYIYICVCVCVCVYIYEYMSYYYT